MSKKEWQTLTANLEQLSPAEKLELIERLAHSMRAEAPMQSVEQKREALKRLREELAKLPVANPNDGFSASNHDEVLYGV
jgi:hypothetical protein